MISIYKWINIFIQPGCDCKGRCGWTLGRRMEKLRRDVFRGPGPAGQPHYTFGDALNTLTFDLSHLSRYFHNASVSNVVATYPDGAKTD